MAEIEDSSDQEDFLNPQDFQSVRLVISIMNNTTQTAIQNDKRVYGTSVGKATHPDKDLSIKLLEIQNDGIVIDVPTRSCAENHRLDVKIATKNYTKGDFDLTLAGTVTQVERQEDERDRLTIHLTRYQKDEWQKLQDLFGSRQAEIEEFLRSVRGF